MLIYFNVELPCKISKSVAIGFCTQPVTVLSSDETRTNRSRNFFGTVLVLIPRPKSQICHISQDREISWLRRHTSMRLWNILMAGFVFKTRSIYNDTTTDTLRYLAKVWILKNLRTKTSHIDDSLTPEDCQRNYKKNSNQGHLQMSSLEKSSLLNFTWLSYKTDLYSSYVLNWFWLK